MLYPKEDRQNRVLLFACRNCEHQEEADHHCVYRNEFRKAARYEGDDWSEAASASLAADFVTDATLPRTTKALCPKCGNNEAVFFQAREGHKDAGMALFFVCCNPQCTNMWGDKTAV